MAKKKSSSAGKKAHYNSYKAQGQEEKNRARKLAKHMKAHPNDKQTEAAMALKPVHRKTPQGRKSTEKRLGIQEVSPGLFKYVAKVDAYPNGHPANAKNLHLVDLAKKMKNSAKLSEDFKATYPQYVS